MQLILGGKTIELVFPGKNHGDDGTVIIFPAERVVFAADFPADALVRESLRSLPSACGNFDGHPLLEWIRSSQCGSNVNRQVATGRARGKISGQAAGLKK